ncbi:MULTISPECIES: phosphate acyltransferase PlsX [unclassified Halomonas]|uniref:phosphate acyltransferase PlsX n=1 Tax=unclassified Halomonas TaxID=2609666 RepID=UPI0006D9543A|nr:MULTISPECIES: phosphate acyltransferase PlsX [unclassified Halomonas]KPQ20125.1 MAG: fatty acid/phospholipid synthesis protein PlsX [Halomonas sp. HL-93]SBR49521.1 phosphate:acyl-[acyl carrier protein] acyltransferase [Halomonas sp. HL-93]SNY96413.1 phosphate:acyl-[acyl carrier protein] acyltransferase [Halomonas sp. hl-4]
MRLAIDVMGGDQGPRALIEGAARAVTDTPGLELILFGPHQQIDAELLRLPRPLAAATSRLAVHDVVDSMAPTATAAWALRHGQSTSMAQMLRCVALGDAQAGVSVGNTAALVALSRRELGTLAGMSRPAISTAIPARHGRHCYLLDLGANVDSPASRLVEFALMGAAMAQQMDGVDRPRVALLNVGAESTKGSASVREADRLLRDSAATLPFAYCGYAEGGDIFQGELDVIVCDGFAGNAVLKASEGLASMLIERVQLVFSSRLRGRLASWIAKPVLKHLKQELDPVRYNGASLLGLQGIVVKSHGGTHADGFYYAIRRAMQEVEHNLPERLAKCWSFYG